MKTIHRLLRNLIPVVMLAICLLTFTSCFQGKKSMETGLPVSTSAIAEEPSLTPSEESLTAVVSETAAAEATPEDPYTMDCNAFPYLKYAASEVSVGSVNYYSGGFNWNYFSGDYARYGITDKNELEFKLKEIKKGKYEKMTVGEYTLFMFGELDILIAKKDRPLEESFAYIYNNFPQGLLNFEKSNFLTNSNNDLYLLGESLILYIRNGTESPAITNVPGYALSKNRRFLAYKDAVPIGSNPDDYRYILFDFETGAAFEILCPKSEYQGKKYTPDNFIIGDKGEFVIGTGVRGGDECGSAMTGFGASALYRGKFSGSPLYLSEKYLIYADKYAFYKLSDAGEEKLFKMVELEKDFYNIHVSRQKKIMDSNIGLSKSGSIGNKEEIYIFDCENLELFNGVCIIDGSIMDFNPDFYFKKNGSIKKW